MYPILVAVLLSSLALPCLGGDTQTSFSDAELATRLKPLTPAGLQALLQDPLERENFMREMVTLRAIETAAQSRGLEERPEVLAELATTRREILLRHLLADDWREHPLPRDAIRALAWDLFAAAPDRYQAPRKIKVAQIAKDMDPANPLAAREALVEAKRRIEAGEAFTTVAQEVSDLPNAAQGGLVGKWFVETTKMKEASAVKPIFALKELGEVTDPFQIGAMFHIFILVAETPAHPLPYIRVRGSLEGSLTKFYQDQREQTVIRALQPPENSPFDEEQLLRLVKAALPAQGATP